MVLFLVSSAFLQDRKVLFQAHFIQSPFLTTVSTKGAKKEKERYAYLARERAKEGERERTSG